MQSILHSLNLVWNFKTGAHLDAAMPTSVTHHSVVAECLCVKHAGEFQKRTEGVTVREPRAAAGQLRPLPPGAAALGAGELPTLRQLGAGGAPKAGPVGFSNPGGLAFAAAAVRGALARGQVPSVDMLGAPAAPKLSAAGLASAPVAAAASAGKAPRGLHDKLRGGEYPDTQPDSCLLLPFCVKQECVSLVLYVMK